MKFASIVSLGLFVSFGATGHPLKVSGSEATVLASADAPADEVKATIKKMLVLIDERKTLELLEKYTDIPAEARKMVAERVDQDKLDELKKYLGMAAKMTPKITDDGKTALFEDEEFPRPMKFVKSGQNWVMKDK